MLGILDDVKVLDLSNTVGGAFCAKLLSDQGAQTIKIERPGAGDPTRHEPPFLGGVPDIEQSSLFLAHNTNKRGITLNLETVEGRAILLRLVKTANVVVESFTPGYLNDLGIDYDAMRKVNPSIILVSLTFFGQTGPYAQYKGDELICEAMGGFLYAVTGFNDQPPMGTALHQMELSAARGGVIATMAALLKQKATGDSQHIDVTVLEATVTTPQLIHGLSYAGRVGRRGGGDTNVMDGMHLKTKDGEVTLTTAGTGGRPLETWAEFLGEPKLLDAKFKTVQGRRKYYQELFDLVQNKLLEWKNLDLMREATAKGLVIGLVQDIQQVLDSPHLQERQFWVEIDHPVAGKMKYSGPAFLVDNANPAAGSAPAPTLGQHNDEVYIKELRIGKEELSILAATGVV